MRRSDGDENQRERKKDSGAQDAVHENLRMNITQIRAPVFRRLTGDQRTASGDQLRSNTMTWHRDTGDSGRENRFRRLRAEAVRRGRVAIAPRQLRLLAPKRPRVLPQCRARLLRSTRWARAPRSPSSFSSTRHCSSRQICRCAAPDPSHGDLINDVRRGVFAAAAAVDPRRQHPAIHLID